MATSGSTDWTQNRDQVITGALRKLAVLPSGGSPTTAQTNDAVDALNGLVKVFHADGMPLWKITSHTFSLTDGTNSYTIGVGQTLNTAKPLRVFQAIRTSSEGNEIPMNVYPRYDYNELPITNSEGIPINLYYQPLNTTGVIKLWPTPDSTAVGTTITIHYQAPFEDMDSAANTFDFPSEWIQPLIYNLAWTLAPEYGLPPTDRKTLSEEARYWHEKVLSMGSEEGSIYLQPEGRG